MVGKGVCLLLIGPIVGPRWCVFLSRALGAYMNRIGARPFPNAIACAMAAHIERVTAGAGSVGCLNDDLVRIFEDDGSDDSKKYDDISNAPFVKSEGSDDFRVWLRPPLIKEPVERSEDSDEEFVRELCVAKRHIDSSEDAQWLRELCRQEAFSGGPSASSTPSKTFGESQRSRSQVCGLSSTLYTLPHISPTTSRAQDLARQLQSMPNTAIARGQLSDIFGANECERVCLRTCEATVGMSIEELIEQVRMHITTCLEQHAPCIFKIGITTGLVHRFYNADYGYIREGYQRMYGLAMLPTPHSRILEQLLILEFGSRQGCRNVAGGGDGKSDGDADLCFTYLVLVGADEYMKWRKRRKR